MGDASTMAGTWQIRAERPDDAAAVDALSDQGFGPGRFAKTAYRLREGVDPEAALSFVATQGGVLVGAVRFWPIAVDRDKALLLGPLAVREELRGRGIGVALMKHGIEAARAADYAAILLVGDEPYYGRAGFARLKPGQVRLPGPVDPARVLGLALKREVSGRVRRARIDHPVCADGAGLG
jgi:predicted N-acetyltransferase YhbS